MRGIIVVPQKRSPGALQTPWAATPGRGHSVSDHTTIPEGYKRCTKCGEIKLRADFSIDRSRPLGFRSHCKLCSAKAKKQWQQSHEDEVREYSRRRYIENADENRETARQYYIDHREKRREYSRRYRAEHPDKIKEYNRRYHGEHPADSAQQREYHHQHYMQHRDEVRDRVQRYQKAHRDQRYESIRRRQARKLGLPFDFINEDEIRALDYWHGCCAYCGKPLRDLFGDVVPHLDHFVPLSDPRPDNPGTVPTNILPTCSPCNLSKNACDPIEWLTEKFGARQARKIIDRITRYFEWVRNEED